MLKFFKYLVYFLLVVVLLGGIAVYFMSESEPAAIESSTTAEADALADKMMAAVNVEAWQNTEWVQWTFKGVHSFLWDKKRNWCVVTWDEGKKVLLKMDEIDGKAFINNVEQNEADSAEMIQTAWSYFCNDSFWLNAVVKAKDPGTSRSIVRLDDGRQGLKVQYASGGVTPGDSYVWIMDDNFRPTAYKMWVSIIPVGGLEFSWENWQTLNSGAQIATLHRNEALTLDISNLKDGQSFGALGFEQDPFEALK